MIVDVEGVTNDVCGCVQHRRADPCEMLIVLGALFFTIEQGHDYID